MTLLNPAESPVELLERLHQPHQWVVACYCAEWCDTCRSYRPHFAQLAAERPQDVFVWVDIEDSEEMLDDEEVENFPTLLIQGPQGNVFYGPMLPHIQHLHQLLARLEPDAPPLPQGPGPLKTLLPAAQ